MSFPVLHENKTLLKFEFEIRWKVGECKQNEL